MLRALLAPALVAAAAADACAQLARPDDFPLQAGLPNPLVSTDLAPATTADQWPPRRAELRSNFQRYMYGNEPAPPERVVGRVLFEDKNAFAGAGVLREVELTFGPPEWPKIYLLIATPKSAAPAPCFVGCNFAGNHLRTADQRVRLPTTWMPEGLPGVTDNRAADSSRGLQAAGWDIWPLAAAVQRGYAVATFSCGDIQPDRPDVSEGMRATMPASATQDPAATGAIMWWAWGIHRAVDYLVTDPAIDARRIAVVGHSRLGKTALLAGAFDERIALVVANQAGCGGSAPSRHDDPRAETVAVITSKFPHWFCQNFAAFGADPARLPFDQDCLVALCAPRPVLFTAAAEDVWANPAGQFEVLRAATPAYGLLGVDGMEATTMPRPGDPLIASRLGYWIRPGQHAMTEADWQTYMDFADKW